MLIKGAPLQSQEGQAGAGGTTEGGTRPSKAKGFQVRCSSVLLASAPHESDPLQHRWVPQCALRRAQRRALADPESIRGWAVS